MNKQEPNIKGITEITKFIYSDPDFKSAISNPTTVKAYIWIEDGCDFTKGEYSVRVSGEDIPLDGKDLIEECIENELHECMDGNIPKEKSIEITMIETGETDDCYRFDRYYVITDIRVVDIEIYEGDKTDE